MKKILLVACILVFCSGCASVIEVLDIISPDEPQPVCDADSAGTVWQGQTCLKYDNDNYKWTNNE